MYFKKGCEWVEHLVVRTRFTGSEIIYIYIIKQIYKTNNHKNTRNFIIRIIQVQTWNFKSVGILIAVLLCERFHHSVDLLRLSGKSKTPKEFSKMKEK